MTLQTQGVLRLVRRMELALALAPVLVVVPALVPDLALDLDFRTYSTLLPYRMPSGYVQ